MMNYKETFLFIGKCLTLLKEETNRAEVREDLLENRVDWDKIVQVSTEHYVFPTLYVNLRELDLLNLLPVGLVEFMTDVYVQNHDRNRAILQQAKDINAALKEHGIAAVFMNGVGLLLDGLYQDVGERMISDIDLLVDASDIESVVEILGERGYLIKSFNKRELKRGTTRLIHDVNVAAVGIKTKVIRNSDKFTLDEFMPAIRMTKDDCRVMSYSQQMFMAIMTAYHNGHGYNCYAIPLRNIYDVHLLSSKVVYFDFFTKTPKFFVKINAFMVMANYITGSKSLLYVASKKSNQFLGKIQRLIEDPRRYRKKIWFNLFLVSIKKWIRNMIKYPYWEQLKLAFSS
ncbi:nucleotidyltransferase family protein [Allomuricauda taeanensis]|uniref:nucleotidyltransferase family protein n=1 Tax=Flagellimonas taeanensis TaxID=1005926 RepID=UPI002E7C1D3E|nr:nucleotidyltransferase family protein [Allomuricauda taeanensis]MEE1964566.1 nucleotidyltransferase family protein [Allomuricauda taeanensis]